MKNIFKSALALGVVASMALTGCIEETFPTGSVSQDQLSGSASAGEAAIYAIPAYLYEFNSGMDWHPAFGYASMMHQRDLMTGDCVTNSSDGNGYNHWTYMEKVAHMNEDYIFAQYIYNYYTSLVLCTNKAAAIFYDGVENPEAQGSRAVALAFRAMAYLDMARWYEFLPTEFNPLTGDSIINHKGNNIYHLTVPIVTENTTEADSYNNPRATREEMAAFIEGDLKYAEEHIADSPYDGPQMPDLACVYGLFARLYMWLEDYPKAKEYADKALAEFGGSPLTREQWTNTTSGFNTPYGNSSWMWSFQPEKESRTVTTGICNWVSFMSFEAIFGYASAKAGPQVDLSFYNRVKNQDFRKLSWVPLKSYSNKNLISYVDPKVAAAEKYDDNFQLCSVKFRPASGNIDDNSVACLAAVPLMRMEEMKFISLEAQAHTADFAAAKADLIQWMNTYRMMPYQASGKPATFSFTKTKQEDIIEEIVFQKRVELWGEGQSFFDIKRLGITVTRDYKDTNYYKAARLNTNGRPAWMNLPIVQTEGNSNKAVKEFNNVPIDGLYKAPQ